MTATPLVFSRPTNNSTPPVLLLFGEIAPAQTATLKAYTATGWVTGVLKRWNGTAWVLAPLKRRTSAIWI